jgi:hypothetical protein
MLGKDVRIKKSLLMCGIIPSSNVEGGGVVRANGVVARARHARGISKPHQNVPHDITSFPWPIGNSRKLDEHLILLMHVTILMHLLRLGVGHSNY